MKIKSKIWVEKDKNLVFGPGKALILKTVAKTGSLNKAAKKLNMSYRHAWSYIRSAEKRLGSALMRKVRGGGAYLTDYAKSLLMNFEKIESKVKLFADRQYKKYGIDQNYKDRKKQKKNCR